MSVFGSLFTAVSGLSAQSEALSMISNNIANVSTVGYKRTDASFSSLVTSGSRSTIYSPGSVRARQNASVNQQGILQQSNSTTDMAMSGNGFLVVRQDANSVGEPLYTRAASFSEDSSGVLRNTSGFFLYGWPLDQDGNLPAGQADISSLVPVNLAFLGGLTQPTTSAALAVNLDANEDISVFPVPTGFAPDFTRGIRVFDSLGATQDVTVNFKHHETPTAIALGIDDLSGMLGALDDQATLDATDTFDITVGATGPTTITLDGDMGKLLSDLNAIVDGLGEPVLYAKLDDNGQLKIAARTIGDDITLADGAGTPLTDGLGLAGSIGVSAAPTGPTLLTALDETANTEGWWHISFVSGNGTIISEGSVNFNGSGQMNGTPDADGKVIVPLDDIDWGNGSTLQDVEFDLAGISQFSGEYNVISTTQNGAELGLRTGVTISREGYVVAQFSNGKSSQIYKLPIATFANANGLSELTGNVYRESDTSGNFNLNEAGAGSAGLVEGGALEASNVDVADEFSKMIITQRAYSANTKVIQTADQMSAELLNLR